MTTVACNCVVRKEEKKNQGVKPKNNSEPEMD